MSTQESRVKIFEQQKQVVDCYYRGVDAYISDWESAFAWIHTYPLKTLDAILGPAPQRILTLGDGRGALESRYLKTLGHDAVPGDVCVDNLRNAKDCGLIDEYLELNAENLDLPDQSFDFVLMKEALHHLQRPYLGIYEMLRVAKKGLILLEPHREYPSTITACFKEISRRLLRREGSAGKARLPTVKYESIGNYLYFFSAYEFTQAALALGITDVAFRFCHRPYEHGDDCSLTGDELKRFIRRRKIRMIYQDLLKGRQRRPVLCYAMFKSVLTQEQKSRLIASGYDVPQLQENPILQKAA